MMKKMVAIFMTGLFAVTSVTAGNKPFPQNLSYGLKPSTVTTAGMQSAIQTKYDWYISTFLKVGDVGGKYIEAKDTDGTKWTETVSEAHGYGMMLSAIMDDRATFDQMVTFYQQYKRSANNLMKWRVWGGGSADDGSATDGDLDIAYALLLADAQWGGTTYKNLAIAIIQDIWDNDMFTAGTYLLPNCGDQWYANSSYGADQYTRPSDWMPGHFRAFEVVDPANDWSGAANSVYSFYNQYRNSTTGLVPDFFYGYSPASGGNAIEDGTTDAIYYYNACRVPLRMAMDFATSGNSSAQATAKKIGDWITSATGGNADNIASGYYLNGGTYNTQYTDLVFQGPFGAAQIATSNQAMLNSIWAATTQSYNYQIDNAYGAAVSILSMLVMSGNWWGPSSVTAPNTAPTDITISNSTVIVGGSTTVGTLSTVDANDYGAHTYTTTTAGWSISGDVLTAPANLTEGTVSVSVKSTDAGGLSFTKNLSITVRPTGSANGTELTSDTALYKWELDFDTTGGTQKVSFTQVPGNITSVLTFPAVDTVSGIYPYGVISYYDDLGAFKDITKISITYKSTMETSLVLVQSDPAYAGGGSHEYLLPSSGGVDKTVTVLVNNTNFKNPQWWIDEGNTAKSINFANINGLSVSVSGSETGGSHTLTVKSFFVEGYLPSTTPVVSSGSVVKSSALAVQTVGGSLKMQFMLPKTAEVKATLFTPSGRAVAQTTTAGVMGSNTLQMHTQGLAQGLYLLRVESAGVSQTARVNIR